MEGRALTKDLLVTTYADVRKDITAKTVKVCSQIIKLCIYGESKTLSFPVIATETIFVLDQPSVSKRD